MRHFCPKHYKTRCTPVKRHRINNPRHGQHPERDPNEIRKRYEFASFEAIEGQDRAALQDAPGFSLLERQMSLNNSKTRYTPEKRDRHEFGYLISAVDHMNTCMRAQRSYLGNTLSVAEKFMTSPRLRCSLNRDWRCCACDAIGPYSAIARHLAT